MGDGKKANYLAITKEVLSGRRAPIVGGVSWLAHDGEAAKVDGMILEGLYTIDQIAGRLRKEQPSSSTRTLDQAKSRVRGHLSHLRTTWNGKMAPHEFEIDSERGGILRFQLGVVRATQTPAVACLQAKPTTSSSATPKTQAVPPETSDARKAQPKLVVQTIDVPSPKAPSREETLLGVVRDDIDALDAEEGREEFFEGERKQRVVSLYERKPALRAQAILIHGTACKVCGFDFGSFYGERGIDYIEVHHIRPVSSLGGSERVDPRTDMTVLCSNCHRMVHRSKEYVLSIHDLRDRLKRVIQLPR